MNNFKTDTDQENYEGCGCILWPVLTLLAVVLLIIFT